MFVPLAITFVIIFIVVMIGRKKKPYDSFPMDNEDTDYWRNLNN